MFRFSIRELILITVIVATFLAWWVDRSQNMKEFMDARESMKARYEAYRSGTKYVYEDNVKNLELEISRLKAEISNLKAGSNK